MRRKLRFSIENVPTEQFPPPQKSADLKCATAIKSAEMAQIRLMRSLCSHLGRIITLSQMQPPKILLEGHLQKSLKHEKTLESVDKSGIVTTMDSESMILLVCQIFYLGN